MTNQTLTSRQAAAVLGIGLRRLQVMRRCGELLPFARNERGSCLYSLADCQAWLEAQKWGGGCDPIADIEATFDLVRRSTTLQRPSDDWWIARLAEALEASSRCRSGDPQSPSALLTRPFPAVSGGNIDEKEKS